MSNYMLGGAGKMVREVRKYYDGPLLPPDAKTMSEPILDFFFSYDVMEEAKKLLEEHRRAFAWAGCD